MIVFKGLLAKFLKVHDTDYIAIIRHNSDLPHTGTVIEQRRLNLVNKLLDNNYLTCLFMV